MKQTNHLEITISSGQETVNNLLEEEIISRSSEINAGRGRTFTMKEFEDYISSEFPGK
ncbi:MAG: hypothetical protein SH857_17140 [Chitinophagales bacterium]|nr:hypothetical protein [Chitinophagales bacterium]